VAIVTEELRLMPRAFGRSRVRPRSSRVRPRSSRVRAATPLAARSGGRAAPRRAACFRSAAFGRPPLAAPPAGAVALVAPSVGRLRLPAPRRAARFRSAAGAKPANC